MRLDELDYSLPSELIAQVPVEPRDAARLLVVGGGGAALSCDDRAFRDLPGLLRRGDVLVRNDTRVIPARARFRKSTGGRVELLFLERLAGAAADPPPGAGETWEALARGRLRAGETLRSEAAPDELAVEVEAPLGEGRYRVRPAGAATAPVADLLERYGETPLPPYIRAALADPERYQTVFARPRGSAAAPTAGLHFTPELLIALRERGIRMAYCTLHIGLDTFLPVREDDLEEHKMHTERAILRAEDAKIINEAKLAGGRIVAVGTTAVRTLETAALKSAGVDDPYAGQDDACPWRPVIAIDASTDLFIRPGYRFRAVDGLITNFHLPRSTLLALVSAFAGRGTILDAYRVAQEAGYRFYSFGDAMLIL